MYEYTSFGYFQYPTTEKGGLGWYLVFGTLLNSSWHIQVICHLDSLIASERLMLISSLLEFIFCLIGFLDCCCCCCCCCFENMIKCKLCLCDLGGGVAMCLGPPKLIDFTSLASTFDSIQIFMQSPTMLQKQ